jgi:hypothetical protein
MTNLGRVGGNEVFCEPPSGGLRRIQINYAQFDFNQAQGQTAGIQGDYMASHVVGGLAWHF